MATILNGCEALRDYQSQWYAVYTRAQHEKMVATLLEAKGFRVFFPQQEVKRRFSRWGHSILLPLFPGYVFTNFCWNPHDAHKIRTTHGVVSIVGSSYKPHSIPDDEIRSIEQLVIHRIRCRPVEHLTKGQRVTIKAGPMRGVNGLVVKHKKRTLFVVAVELLQRSLSIDIDLHSLEVLN